MKTFGQRVRQARMRKGWTQRELANASGLTQSAIGNYESGQRVDPTGAALLSVAQALDVSPAWLSQGKGAIDGLSTKTTKSVRDTAGSRNGDNTGEQNSWPFRKVRFESYLLLSAADKRVLDSLVTTFIGSCIEKS